MHADIEQDVDGELWLLVDGPDGKVYKIAHEMATGLPDLPPITFPLESSQWQVGDRVAMHPAGERWLVMDADAARKMGVDESSSGWIFSEVVSDGDTPG